ncbi:MAG: hypothetical protein WKF62_09740 [Solirubrobacterales bacterium]
MKGERAQASFELLASVPAMVLALVIALQLAITGYTLHLADGAAEAGALAVAADTDPVQAARAALPGWAAERVDVSAEDGRIEVSVRPPAPLESLSEVLEVRASAWARSADGG